jgi:enoyl-CoA hydratase/carnithine racemase
MTLVRTRRVGEVAVLTLDRPDKLNALSSALERDLAAALEADSVTTAAAVVLEGAGRAFSAGADVNEMRDQSVEAILGYYRATGELYERVASLRQPTVAAIHGYCLGGGLELALACDLRVVARSAVLGLPEVELGILPSSGGTFRLVRAVGPARARELVLLRRRFDAEEGRRLGIVTEVVEEDPAARAVEIAADLASLPPLAVEVTKRTIDAATEAGREAALLLERLAYAALAQTGAHREATEAFERGRAEGRERG